MFAAGVYGHSTVYHPHTRSLYVFGGYIYSTGKSVRISNKLYALHLPTRQWSLLPAFDEYNPPDLMLVSVE